jgi:iron complex outermembrane receptor protein
MRTPFRITRVDRDIAVFYNDYSQLQVETPSGIAAIITNAASARIYGVDADASVKVTREFSVGAGIELLSAKYTSFPNATLVVPITLPNGDPCYCGNNSNTGSASGNYLDRAPKLTFSSALNYVRDLPGGKLDLSTNVYYSSRYFVDVVNRVDQRAYTTVNVRGGFTFSGTGLTLSLWGRNLANSLVYSTEFINQQADGVSYMPPRTYGISAKYAF